MPLPLLEKPFWFEQLAPAPARAHAANLDAAALAIQAPSRRRLQQPPAGVRRDFRVRTTRTLGGAKRSLYRGERCADYGANPATIARARPTRAGRSAGGANEAARSFRER